MRRSLIMKFFCWMCPMWCRIRHQSMFCLMTVEIITIREEITAVCLFDKLASAYVHFEIRGTKTLWNARITAISVVQMICVLYLRYPETFWLYRNGLYVTMTVVNFEKSIFDINFQKKGKIHFSIEQYPQFFQKYVIVYHMIFVTNRISFDQFSKNKYNWPPSTPQFTFYFSSP